MNDTSPDITKLQIGIGRRLTGSQGMALAFEMTRVARELCLSRLRKEHPQWSDRQLKLELVRYAFLTAEGPPLELPAVLR